MWIRLGPIFADFYYIFSFTSQKSLNFHWVDIFSPRGMSIEYIFVGTMMWQCLNHIRAMISLFPLYICFHMSEMTENFTEWLASVNNYIALNLSSFLQYGGNVWTKEGLLFYYLNYIFASTLQSYWKFHWMIIWVNKIFCFLFNYFCNYGGYDWSIWGC